MGKRARQERRSLAYARDCTLRESTILNREMSRNNDVEGHDATPLK
jgi:hypothetical protein